MHNQRFRFLVIWVLISLPIPITAPLALAAEAAATAAAQADPSQPLTSAPTSPSADTVVQDEPWDYSPYKVHIWITSNHERANVEQLSKPLHEFLDRAFSAVWRLGISTAPIAISAGANRDFESMSYASITASDAVLALKRDHPDAVRIRTAADVAKYIKKCQTTADRLAEIKRRGAAIDNPTLDGLEPLMNVLDGDSLAVAETWKDASTEAVILTRGMASKLRQPEAKIVRLPIAELVDEQVQSLDKLFVVRVDCNVTPMIVEAAELDCLMRHFSPVVSNEALDFASLPAVIGQTVIDAFAPVVRIEDAGQKTAVGLTRAAGLVVDEQSPALIDMGEFLQPMVRKDDRNGNPLALGTIAWAYLHVKKVEGARVEMDFYAGQSGGLQGRKNNRTFRMALRTRPIAPDTTLRLRAQGAGGEPLVGYEVYEKQLDSIDMQLVGRTDWDGRLTVDKSDAGMRLLYVKNGGAVLARLPVVPGLEPVETADLSGDDQRLRAEAYIRGTQNAIVDLIAIRTLLGARIRLKLEKGKLEEAKELLEAVKAQPTYDTIANDMGKKIIQIKGRNINEQRKIDLMFAQTREMLVKNINGSLLNELEAAVAKAEANNGVLPPSTEASAEPSIVESSDTPAAVAPQ